MINGSNPKIIMDSTPYCIEEVSEIEEQDGNSLDYNKSEGNGDLSMLNINQLEYNQESHINRSESMA